MKFAVENFKIFKERQEFDLKPITILVGPNGSGKSSVIKALELLNNITEKPSVYVSYIEPFLNILKQIPNENTPNVYSFNSLLHGYKSNSFSIECFSEVPIDYIQNNRLHSENLITKLTYQPAENNFFGYLSTIEIFDDQKLFCLTRNKRSGASWKIGVNIKHLVEIFNLEMITYDGCEFNIEENFLQNSDGEFREYNLNEKNKIKALFESEDLIFYNADIYDLNYVRFEHSFFISECFKNKELANIQFSGNSNGRSAHAFFNNFLPRTFKSCLESCLSTFNKGIIINTNRLILEDQSKFTNVGDLMNLSMFVNQLNDKQLKNYLSLVSNFLSLILNKDITSLKFDFNKNGKFDISYNKNEKFTKLHDEAQGIISLFGIIAIIGYHFFDVEEADLISGYLYEQINLPKTMLEGTINEYRNMVMRRCFILQEPEMNLHPNAQSRMADLLSKILNLGPGMKSHFVLETHSEYLIRRFQYLVAKGEIKKEDIQIYYFNDPDKKQDGDEIVYPININDDGSLSRPFGPGFYDEADNIALELLLLNKEQKN